MSNWIHVFVILTFAQLPLTAMFLDNYYHEQGHLRIDSMFGLNHTEICYIGWLAPKGNSAWVSIDNGSLPGHWTQNMTNLVNRLNYEWDKGQCEFSECLRNDTELRKYYSLQGD